MFMFPVQLTTSRIGKVTRLIHTDDHTLYIYTTSNELDVQNEWEENTHTQHIDIVVNSTISPFFLYLYLHPLGYY